MAVEMFKAELMGEVLKGVEWNEDDVRGVAVKVELGTTSVASLLTLLIFSQTRIIGNQ